MSGRTQNMVTTKESSKRPKITPRVSICLYVLSLLVVVVVVVVVAVVVVVVVVVVVAVVVVYCCLIAVYVCFLFSLVECMFVLCI